MVVRVIMGMGMMRMLKDLGGGGSDDDGDEQEQ